MLRFLDGNPFRIQRRLGSLALWTEVRHSSGLGDPGSGAGKGGGGGGPIRSSGGAFGKREAALEGQYFNKLQRKQLEKLKKMLSESKGPEETERELESKKKRMESRRRKRKNGEEGDEEQNE